MNKIRCAIYTRKSTEEGLEQEFNSLDAQREACEAYIKSQKGLGWICLNRSYDDGGLSGGNMSRPALQDLLADVEAGLVDLVVVYKVDRLTRSLADFAKIVERLDDNSASFASVTQQFNTSTSMGRMTLNVLMTFAQFEREVTAERIRDKIAASKKKGMWMGGAVPLGYDNVDKALVINKSEAQTIRLLFDLYLELDSVKELAIRAEQIGVRTKVRTVKGEPVGGLPFSRGHLYQMLKNPLYVGKVAHKGNVYEGLHEGIIDPETWDAVQVSLKSKASPRKRATNVKDIHLLTGILYDEYGERLSPTHAVKNGKRYRYYVASNLDQDPGKVSSGWRLPTAALDSLVINALTAFLSDDSRLINELGHDTDTPLELRMLIGRAASLAQQFTSPNPGDQAGVMKDLVARVDIDPATVRIQLHAGFLVERELDITLDVPMTLKRRGVETKMVVNPRDRGDKPDKDQTLVALIASAHHWFSQLASGKAKSVRDVAQFNGVAENDVSRFLPLAFLAPDIVEAIIAGEHPQDLQAEKLKRLSPLPQYWVEQRRLLGFTPI